MMTEYYFNTIVIKVNSLLSKVNNRLTAVNVYVLITVSQEQINVRNFFKIVNFSLFEEIISDKELFHYNYIVFLYDVIVTPASNDY